MARTALLVGATGLVGGYCLDALLGDPEYLAVSVLGRRVVPRQHSKLRQHVVDFDHGDSYRDAVLADDVFCCLGTTIAKAGSQQAFRKVDFGYPVAIAKAAVAQGARQFLMVSAVGARSNAAAFYSRVKGEVEDAVRALPFHAVCLFRPSLLVGPRHESRPAERAAIVTARALSFAMVGGLRRFRPIDARTVAICMVTIAKRQLAGVHVFESEQIASCVG